MENALLIGGPLHGRRMEIPAFSLGLRIFCKGDCSDRLICDERGPLAVLSGAYQEYKAKVAIVRGKEVPYLSYAGAA